MSGAATKSVALWVIRVLRKAGFEALLAGGCVRDMLLGIRSTDYDVATNATPDQVRKLFRHVLLVGAQFGVAMVIVERRRVEVTTFRSEDSYIDGRRPEHVRFTTAREDALRRDFTINGMFYDPIAGEVIDYVGGQQDLRRRVVRTIGNPEDRFSEDYLRMIRAARFAVRLDFAIEPATAAAAKHHAAKITGISGERVFDELGKMLARPTAPQALAKLEELGLARHILPELFASPEAWAIAMARVAAVAKKRDLTLTLAVLLADLPNKMIVAIIRRWGGSNILRDDLVFLATHLRTYEQIGRMSLADLKRLMANRSFARLLKLWRVEEKRLTGRNVLCRVAAGRAGAIAPDQVAPPPFVTGVDLKTLGLTEGPALGKILRAIYDMQLGEQIRTRQEALATARKMTEENSSKFEDRRS